MFQHLKKNEESNDCIHNRSYTTDVLKPNLGISKHFYRRSYVEYKPGNHEQKT